MNRKEKDAMKRKQTFWLRNKPRLPEKNCKTALGSKKRNVIVGVFKCLCHFVVHVELAEIQTLQNSKSVHKLEKILFFTRIMAIGNVVSWNTRVDVMNVMIFDTKRDPAQNPRHLKKGRAKNAVGEVVPSFLAAAINFRESVLDAE